MKETDGYLVEDDEEITQEINQLSPISQPEVLPVHNQESKVANQPKASQVQETDKVTKIESVSPDIKNEAVTGCNQDQYHQVNNYNAPSANSNYSTMQQPLSATNYGPAIQTHNQHVQSAQSFDQTHHSPGHIPPSNHQHHQNQTYQQPTVPYPSGHLPTTHQQSHVAPPTHHVTAPIHQSPPTQSQYGEETYCQLEPIDSPKSNCSSGIGSLNSPTTCYQTIYDQTQDMYAHAKSTHESHANHAQVNINITDLNPQSLLNCSSAEFEATMNHLFYL